MDANHFDTLATRLSDHLTRRHSLGALAALGLSLGAQVEPLEAKRRKRKKKGDKNKTGNGNTPPDDGCGAGMHRCDGICIPRSQCCTTADCSPETGEVCQDGTCSCPNGMILEFWGACACPEGQRFCNGECSTIECCEDAHCQGNATCVNSECECHDACCRDAECPGVETCENGHCACVPTDFRVCPEEPICEIGWQATTCTEREGKDCCRRVFCTQGGWGFVTNPFCFTQGCRPPNNTFYVGASCSTEQQCTSNADCGSGAECLYVDCCAKSYCVPY